MVKFNIPAESLEHIRQLGERIRVARKRRGWTIVETAAKAGLSRNTLNALELGKPTVALSAYVSVLWALGLDRSLEAVADPQKDSHGQTLEAARRRQRVKKRQASNDEYDF